LITDTSPVTPPADIDREHINELGDHVMTEKTNLFATIDQPLYVISLWICGLCSFEYRESEKCSYIS